MKKQITCSSCGRIFWIQEKETNILKRQYCQNCRNMLSFIKNKKRQGRLTKKQKEQLIKEWNK